MTTYRQDIKQKIRKIVLNNAIKILTKERKSSYVVTKNYIEDCFNYMKHCDDRAYNICYEKYYDKDLIEYWKDFYSSFYQKKSANDLKVVYLCGPEPTNDFYELVNLGVHPQNIWAFENNKVEYNKALQELKRKYPYLKIHNGNIQEFFKNTPKKFDIVYIDACGPLPSTDSNTLSIISSLFKYQRLNSPGILLSNFCCPDFNCTTIKNDYINLIGNYLLSKDIIEDKINDFYLDENGISDSATLINKIIEPNLEFQYSAFITRLLFDIPSYIVPWCRLACSENLWKKLFNNKLCNYIKQQYPEKKGNKIEYFYKHVINNFYLIKNTQGWDYILSSENKLSKKVYGQLYAEPLNDAKKLKEVIYSFYLLTQFYDNNDYNYEELLTQNLKIAMYMCDSLFQGCDVPNASIGFSLLTGQYSYPMHYNLNKCKRWQYKAKQTTMYTDLIVFDECRYIYEWMPTFDLFGESLLQNKNYSLILQLMIDALSKNCQKYNKEYFNYSTFIGIDSDFCLNPLSLSKRILINS